MPEARGTLYRYDGTIRVDRTFSTASALTWLGLKREVGTTRISLRCLADASGQVVQIAYLIDGKRRAVVFRDRDAHVFVMDWVVPIPSVQFRPLDEYGALSALGFALPADRSSLFAVRTPPSPKFVGSPCPANEGCVDLRLAETVDAYDNARWNSRSGRLEVVYNRTPKFQWDLRSDEGGTMPTQIHYREFTRSSGEVARAEYRLTKIERSVLVPRRGSIVPTRATASVLKSGRGFDGEYDPNGRDVWAGYRYQERLWARQAQRDTLPWGSVGGILLLGVVIFMILRLRARRFTSGTQA